MIGVASATSFRWRHRFLTLSKDDRPQRLSGITEADEMYVLESHQGMKRWTGSASPVRMRS